MAQNTKITVDDTFITIKVRLNPKNVVQTASGNDRLAFVRFGEFEDELPEGVSFNLVVTRKVVKKKAQKVVEADADDADDADAEPAPKASKKNNSKPAAKPTKKTTKKVVAKPTKKTSAKSNNREDGDDVDNFVQPKRRAAA